MDLRVNDGSAQMEREVLAQKTLSIAYTGSFNHDFMNATRSLLSLLFLTYVKANTAFLSSSCSLNNSSRASLRKSRKHGKGKRRVSEKVIFEYQAPTFSKCS